MKVAILSPAGAMHRFSGSFKKAIHYAPLTMTTLAGILNEMDHVDVEIYDETIESIPLDLEVDMVLITMITGTAPRCYAFSNHYRKKGITTVIGGVHASILPEEAQKNCDTVLVGFGEIVLPKLIMDYRQNNLKSIYKDTDYPEALIFKKVDRSLLPKDKYITNHSIEASRGCSNECSFCAVNALYSKNVYKKEIKEIINEIESFNSKTVLFVDVNLIADRNFAIQLFKALIPLKKWWFGLVTADIVKDKEVFDLLVKSGCKGLLIGFESVLPGGLNAINKYRNSVADYKELMKIMHGHGIQINGTFCFGTDDDDLDVFDRTIEMVEALKIDLPRYSILTPFPGTPLYGQLAKEKRITDDHWAMYDVQHVVFQPKKMTSSELMQGFTRAWRQTYSTKGIIKRIGRPHLLFPLSVMTNQAYHHYADKLESFTRERMIDNSDIV